VSFPISDPVRASSASRWRHIVSLWLPVVVMAALIFLMSSNSDPPSFPFDIAAVLMPAVPEDKSAHGMTYFVLALLLGRALSDGRWSGLSRRVCALAGVVSVLYGVTDEIHQGFVEGRTMSLADVTADTIGAALAVVALRACAIIAAARRLR
jgi:VanZ family protein